MQRSPRDGMYVYIILCVVCTLAGMLRAYCNFTNFQRSFIFGSFHVRFSMYFHDGGRKKKKQERRGSRIEQLKRAEE